MITFDGSGESSDSGAESSHKRAQVVDLLFHGCDIILNSRYLIQRSRDALEHPGGISQFLSLAPSLQACHFEKQGGWR